jgi:hypothetical protein
MVKYGAVHLNAWDRHWIKASWLSKISSKIA